MNVALRPERLDLISICSGGGGLDLGIELAIPSARSVCMVEREAFAVAQLVSAMEAGLMASAPIWSDARTFNGRAWRGAVDGLIGGIPCQPHSLAGRKQGSHDARDLWSTARRIIVQSRAWFVVIENVAGMLAAGDDEIAGAERVCRDLHKLGFAVEGGLFTASEVGASHQRERVFILAVADPFSQGLEGRSRRDVRHQQSALEQGGEVMDNAIGGGRGAGRDDNRSDERDFADAAGQYPLDDASIARGRGISVQPRRQVEASSNVDRAGAVIPAFLFPPGPDHLPRWASVLASSPELEPAFCRVADGLASRLDIARVDRLRLLGNGVVCLEGAYALRTLITRLAARGSSGATRLIRMMEIAA